jgi:hypothetical protein
MRGAIRSLSHYIFMAWCSVQARGQFYLYRYIRGRIQKFPDWPPGSRSANGTAFCHYVQLYRYFVSESSEFCRHNPLCCFSTSVYCCYFVVDSVRKLLDTLSYIPVYRLEQVYLLVHIISPYNIWVGVTVMHYLIAYYTLLYTAYCNCNLIIV